MDVAQNIYVVKCPLHHLCISNDYLQTSLSYIKVKGHTPKRQVHLYIDTAPPYPQIRNAGMPVARPAILNEWPVTIK